MVTLNEEEQANSRAWNQRQSVSLRPIPEQSTGGQEKEQKVELENENEEQRAHFEIPLSKHKSRSAKKQDQPGNAERPENNAFDTSKPLVSDKTLQKARHMRQATLQTLPDNTTENKNEKNSVPENEAEENDNEPENIEDEEQTKREFYKERIANQQAAEEKIDAADAELSEGSVKQEVDGEGDTSGEATRAITGKVLQLAWEYLIPSCGLTIFYIDIHFFFRYLLHLKLFCAFGEEWSVGMKLGKVASMVKGVGEFAEIGLAIIINAVIFLIIFVIIPSLFNIIFGWL
ncbi:MAG: hypothetical protein WC544_03660 [Patescibacteria group bacterium]